METKAIRWCDFTTGQESDLPVPPEVQMLIDSRLSRWLFLNRLVAKMAGMVLCSPRLSAWLDRADLAAAFNGQVAATYRRYGYGSLNQAFTHRYDRPLHPPLEETTKRWFSAPCDSYLSQRDITGPRLELFPGVWLDLPEMLGSEDPALWHQGWFLLFTLKPHHDHTLDFATTSRVLAPPVELAAGRLGLDSTDLAFIHQAGRHGRTVLDRNHRVITRLEAVAFGEPYCHLEVGASMVNSIVQDFDPSQAVHLRGGQKSHFNFGSTVILVLSEGLRRQLRMVRAIQDHATGSRVCEVKRGTGLLYPQEWVGEASVADGVTVSVHPDGRETLTRTPSRP